MEKFDMTKISSGFENLFDRLSDEQALSVLRDDFEFTDDEIRELGLDCLLPKPDEPNELEEPVLTYRFFYHVKLGTRIDIKAHNEEEAEELAEAVMSDLAITELEDYESGFELIETFN